MTKRILTLHLKRKYWEQIRDGVKVYEYRRANDYWRKRLSRQGGCYDEVHLLLGYPKKNDSSRRLIREWFPPGIHRIQHDKFGPRSGVRVCDQC